MITEDYVSFEIAKLLKEKGFDEPTTKSYYTEGFENPMKFSHDLLPCIRPDEFLCPTLQMAMKWLREVYNINIEIRCTKTYVEAFIMTIEDLPRCLCRGISSNKYEKTCDVAIKYGLTNLI